MLSAKAVYWLQDTGSILKCDLFELSMFLRNEKTVVVLLAPSFFFLFPLGILIYFSETIWDVKVFIITEYKTYSIAARLVKT